MTRLQRPDATAMVGNVADRVKALERRTNGPWIYVGAAAAPAFQNGWSNAGGGLQPMRFRWIYDGGLEIQGSATGGTPATAIFTLPQDYWPDNELRLAASDDTGAFLVLRVLATGDVIAGI